MTPRFPVPAFLRTAAALALLAAVLAPPAAAETPDAPERPNLILIMVDDLGFADVGWHGSEIETPHLDALARGGVRFSQFYNSGRCCPTRASLLTGLHPHETGIGWMTEASEREVLPRETEPPAYQGYLKQECLTLAEALKEAGYATFMTGKWHLGRVDEDTWPRQRGFDRFYGCLEGAMRFFHPEHPRGITVDNERLDTPGSTTDRPFYTTDAFSDWGIRFIREHLEAAPGNGGGAEGDGEAAPFFLYLSHNAPHWPLQAHEEDVAKYRGRYRAGWDQLREDRYRRQVELGLVDPDWPVASRTPGLPDWDSLDEAQQDEMDLKMAVYAAMVDRVDQNLGKMIDFLKEAGVYENTLVLFLSDNGACQEGGVFGRGEFRDVEARNLEHNNAYGEAWANAGNTPFRLYKHFLHEGGAATPFFLHWPARIAPREDWYPEPAQLIDILPTFLDLAGAAYPGSAHGHELPPLDGISLRPAFDGLPLERERPLVFEHQGNASLRDGDWKLVGEAVAAHEGIDASKWELYDLSADRAETNDLAAVHSDKVAAMAAQWETWAARVGVYPRGEGSPPRVGGPRSRAPGAPGLSSASASASASAAAPAPAPDGNAEGPNPEPVAPQIGGRAFTVTTASRHPNPRGVLLAQGGRRFGWALHFVEGKPVFSVRNEGHLVEVAAPEPVSGRVDLTARLDAGTMSLSVGGRVVAEIESPGLIAEQPGIGLFVGLDGVHPVGEYEVPNRFNGTLVNHRVTVDGQKVAMRTPWGEQVTPENVWQEYPRPQLQREQWTNLNGLWDFAIVPQDREEAPGSWEGEILVPFAIESPLSGVERRVGENEALWYRRDLAVEKREGRRYRLNFEAVDYESTVWLNGTRVGRNTGGNLPFSFDVTEALRDGENEILVRVVDQTDDPDAYQLHGKQVREPGGIWYTPVTGIWQTVWMEEVPDVHLVDLHLSPFIDGRVEMRLGVSHSALGLQATARAFLDGREVAFAGGGIGDLVLQIPEPRLWSPDSPTLYELEIRVGEDTVRSYIGLRHTEVVRGPDGHLRFALNGEILFHWGVLDQGWWPDGLLTPPSDEAMLSDIEFLKEAGFNTIRKHIKVEPRRYYWHTDRLGMLVWQDQVSSGTGRRRGEGESSPEWTRLQPDPPEAVWPDPARRQFFIELKKMVDTLHNHPSIVQWVPFNEAWGQHDSIEIGEWLVAYDPNRQVNIACGGNWFPVGHLVSHHQYPHPGFPFELGEGGRFDSYVKAVGEFGGHGFPVAGHLWDPGARNWGYGGLPENEDEWRDRYFESIRLLVELKEQGIAAGIYTQTSDVEGEINGLLTYDRRVRKISAEELREVARTLVE